MANEEQLSILRQGVEVWNKWRLKDIRVNVDLSKADLSNTNLTGAYLMNANLSDANLSEVYLMNAILNDANLSGANLKTTILSGANLLRADLSGTILIGADFQDAYLREANLHAANLTYALFNRAQLTAAYLGKANLDGAVLSGAYLYYAVLEEASLHNSFLCRTNCTGSNFVKADLRGADLRLAVLNETDLTGADLRKANLAGASLIGATIDKVKVSGSIVYGINVWDLKGEFEEQKDLVITPYNQPSITVDNIKVAQFIYLILNNKEIRDVLDTVTTKAVLVLGRFYDERKQVLDALKEALRERGFVPILFDFEPSKQRDLTETIQLLANMAKFVIADITDAKSIPQELSHIIPFLPSVPVQPILLTSEREYAMFEHWRSFKTVLPEFLYRDKQDLVDNLDAKILQPIDAWRKDQDEISVLKERIKHLEAKKG